MMGKFPCQNYIIVCLILQSTLHLESWGLTVYVRDYLLIGQKRCSRIPSGIAHGCFKDQARVAVRVRPDVLYSSGPACIGDMSAYNDNSAI